MALCIEEFLSKTVGHPPFEMIVFCLHPVHLIALGLCSKALLKIHLPVLKNLEFNIVDILAKKMSVCRKSACVFYQTFLQMGYSLSGSLLLQAILGETWEHSDIDLYTSQSTLIPLDTENLQNTVCCKDQEFRKFRVCSCDAYKSLLDRDCDIIMQLLSNLMNESTFRLHKNDRAYDCGTVAKIVRYTEDNCERFFRRTIKSDSYEAHECMKNHIEKAFCDLISVDGKDDTTGTHDHMKYDYDTSLIEDNEMTAKESSGSRMLSDVYSNICTYFDYDFCKNLWNGKTLQVHSVESVLYRKTTTSWKAFARLGDQCMVNHENWTTRKQDNHWKFGYRMNKYTDRGFVIEAPIADKLLWYEVWVDELSAKFRARMRNDLSCIPSPF